MGSNISIYLSDEALAKLDAAVKTQAAADRARGREGRKVANRSSIVEQLIKSHLGEADALDMQVIRYYAVNLGERYGAKKVTLFGSYARGDATATSDVDILLDKGEIRGMRVLDFQDELAEKLGKPVDVVTTAGASARFLERIAANSVVLYES